MQNLLANISTPEPPGSSLNDPRVAFFTDSFREVNGVAHTSRHFARYAQQENLPFLSVHAGPETRSWTQGSFRSVELQHSKLIVNLEKDLAFDVLFIRHLARLRSELKAFRPDLLHITGPSHIGLLGAMLAGWFNIPLVASWHTNVHEFGGRRLEKILRRFPAWIRRPAAFCTEKLTLAIILLLYRASGVLFAPNPELVAFLTKKTHRPTYLMQRGIDTSLFSPTRRTRTDSRFVIGYVGRLSPEKNVRLLVDVERILIAQGIDNYCFLVVGDGGDRQWLGDNLQHREMPGVLQGEALAAAYANMDVFVFPSETDTFGNVVLEALSSGVPTLVSSAGGPKYIIRSTIDGFEADGAGAFADRILQLYRDASLRRTMSLNARVGAASYSWNSVFSSVYGRYREFLNKTPSTRLKWLRRAAPR